MFNLVPTCVTLYLTDLFLEDTPIRPVTNLRMIQGPSCITVRWNPSFDFHKELACSDTYEIMWSYLFQSYRAETNMTMFRIDNINKNSLVIVSIRAKRNGRYGPEIYAAGTVLKTHSCTKKEKNVVS